VENKIQLDLLRRRFLVARHSSASAMKTSQPAVTSLALAKRGSYFSGAETANQEVN
jgi:hypothetical protein